MKNIIVTAYIDIGRKDFVAIPRTNNQYIEYFKFWARIQNEMIIYTQSAFVNEILAIRRDFGLESKTKIIAIDDISQIDKDLYERMVSVASNKYFIDARILPNATSNNPGYSYLMLLKSWFLEDSIKYIKEKDCFVSWVDFGFNHLTGIHKKPEDFDFEWTPNVNEDKITIFALKEYDNKPIFEIVRTLEDYMIGTIIICPKEKVKILKNLYWKSMNSLLDVGFIDDDQLILLMSYLASKNEFDLIICDWNEQFLKTCDHHFEIREKVAPNLLHKISIKYHKNKKASKYTRRSNKLNKEKIKALYK